MRVCWSQQTHGNMVKGVKGIKGKESQDEGKYRRVCGGRKQETEGERANQGKEGERESKTGEKIIQSFSKSIIL